MKKIGLAIAILANAAGIAWFVLLDHSEHRGAAIHVGSREEDQSDNVVDQTAAPPAKENRAERNELPPPDDAAARKLVVGVWEDDYQGKRTMTLREDGTAEMLVELTGMKAKLFASRLRFDMTWTLENARLQKKTTGGEPAVAVKAILATFGDSVDEPILELTSDRLSLLDKDGTTRYHWRRRDRPAHDIGRETIAPK